MCASMSNIKRVKSNNLFDIIYLKSRTEFWAAFVISRAYFGAKKNEKVYASGSAVKYLQNINSVFKKKAGLLTRTLELMNKSSTLGCP